MTDHPRNYLVIDADPLLLWQLAGELREDTALDVTLLRDVEPPDAGEFVTALRAMLCDPALKAAVDAATEDALHLSQAARWHWQQTIVEAVNRLREKEADDVRIHRGAEGTQDADGDD